MTASCLARPLATLAVLLAAAGLAGGCESRSRELQSGSYRAVIELPGGELPFGLEVARENDRPVLLLVNGEERLRVDDVAVAEGQVTAKLAGPGNTLTGRVTGKRLEGEVSMQSRAADARRCRSGPSSARLGASSRRRAPTTRRLRPLDRDVRRRAGLRGTGHRRAHSVLRAGHGQVPHAVRRVRPARGRDARRRALPVALRWRLCNAVARPGRRDGALDGEYWSGSSEPRRFRAVRSTAD